MGISLDTVDRVCALNGRGSTPWGTIGCPPRRLPSIFMLLGQFAAARAARRGDRLEDHLAGTSRDNGVGGFQFGCAGEVHP